MSHTLAYTHGVLYFTPREGTTDLISLQARILWLLVITQGIQALALLVSTQFLLLCQHWI